MPTFPAILPSYVSDFKPPEQRSFRNEFDGGTRQIVMTQFVPSKASFSVRFERLSAAQKVAIENFWLETECNNIPFQLPDIIFRHPPAVRHQIKKSNNLTNLWEFSEPFSIQTMLADRNNPCSYYTASMTFVGVLDDGPEFEPDTEELLARTTGYWRFDSTADWVGSASAADSERYRLVPIGTVTTGARLCGTTGNAANFTGAGILQAVRGDVGFLIGDTTLLVTYQSNFSANGIYTIAGRYDTELGRSWLLRINASQTGTESIEFLYSPDGENVTTLSTGQIARGVKRMITVRRSVSGGFVGLKFNNAEFITASGAGVFSANGVRLTIGGHLANGSVIPSSRFQGRIDGLAFVSDLLSDAEIDFLYNNGNVRQL